MARNLLMRYFAKIYNKACQHMRKTTSKGKIYALFKTQADRKFKAVNHQANFGGLQ